MGNKNNNKAYLRYFLRESPSLHGWDDSRLPVMNWQLDYTFF